MKGMIIEKKSDIGYITFDRPEAMNAINSQVLLDLSRAIDEFENDKDIRLIIFTGKGKAFISGADLDEMINLRGIDAKTFSDKGVKLFRRIERLKIPTISAINGYCFGGGFEFALCTDIRIAGEKATFAFPEAGLGLVPGFSGTQRLPRTIGRSKAKELMFTGKRIKAQQALELGIVSNIYPQEELMNRAEELAKSILANSSMSIEYIKKAIDTGIDINMDSAIELELGIVVPIFGSRDQIEGVSAFKEKRKPNFRK